MHGQRPDAGGRSMAVPAIKDWAEALEDFMVRKKVAIPPEFKTAAQICKMWGYTQQHASKVLNAMVKNGSAEMRKFAVPVDTINKNKFGPRRSYCRRTPFYKIAPSKSPKS